MGERRRKYIAEAVSRLAVFVCTSILIGQIIQTINDGQPEYPLLIVWAEIYVLLMIIGTIIHPGGRLNK